MKVALCLHGLVGTDDKYGTGSKTINYKIGLKHFKKHVFDVNDEVDVYFHTWSEEYKDRLVEAYKPVSCLAEPQPHFSDNPRQQAIHCRWKSAKEVLNLVKENKEQYDFVLLTRFDIAFLVDFDFSQFDSSSFYAQGPKGPRSHGISLINDLWFFSGQGNMLKFAEVYDRLNTGNYIPHMDSNHELARRHLLETGLHENLQYVFKKDWNGNIAKTTTDTPLIRWHYLNKL